MFNLFKKPILLFLSISLASFIVFCNILAVSLINCPLLTSTSGENIAQTLGDRGGSHMPDIGIHLTLEPLSIIIISAIAFLSIVAICVLVHIKHKNSKDKDNNSANIEE